MTTEGKVLLTWKVPSQYLTVCARYVLGMCKLGKNRDGSVITFPEIQKVEMSVWHRYSSVTHSSDRCAWEPYQNTVRVHKVTLQVESYHSYVPASGKKAQEGAYRN